MQVQVESYAGGDYPTEPRTLHWQGQRLEVRAVLARWREPEEVGFRVLIVDERVFDLTYYLLDERWEARPVKG